MSNSSLRDISLSLVVALGCLGYVGTVSAQKVKNCDPDLGDVHPSCKPEEDPPPDDGPVLAACDLESWSLCIASIGKWHGKPAREYAEANGGSYSELSHNDFANVLAALPADDFSQLCDAFQVLVFEWNSPNIKNLTWQSLVDYMSCGGGIIFEDPTNVEALADGIVTEEIQVHDKSESPRTIAFDASCLAEAPTLCNEPPFPGDTWDTTLEFDVVNNHMVFSDAQLASEMAFKPFLHLSAGGGIVGLYGDLIDAVEGGRIVLTGPDNNFHGDSETTPTDPNDDASKNQYDLLSDEIDWLLGL